MKHTCKFLWCVHTTCTSDKKEAMCFRVGLIYKERMHNQRSLTFTLAILLRHLAHDERVGDDDDDEGETVHSDHVEQVVGQLVGRRREKVKRHTLSEPLVMGVVLHVKDDALEENKDIVTP